MLPIVRKGTKEPPKIRALRKMPKACLLDELPEVGFAFTTLKDDGRQYVFVLEEVVVSNFEEFVSRLVNTFGYYATALVVTPLKEDECDIHIYLSEQWRVDSKKPLLGLEL